MFKIIRRCYEEVVHDAKRRLPNEACGILSGGTDTATTFYSMVNAEQSPVSFLMEPKEQFQVMKEIRLRGEKMLAVSHSHVASQAYPSAKDISLALYPEIHYLIVSLSDRERPAVRAFRIEEGKAREESIEVV